MGNKKRAKDKVLRARVTGDLHNAVSEIASKLSVKPSEALRRIISEGIKAIEK